MLLWFKEFQKGVLVCGVRVDCEHNQPTFLATVFYQATAFNRDLNQWDVAKVTTMQTSKWRMTWLVTWTHAIVIEGFSRGVELMVMMWCKDCIEMVARRWCKLFFFDETRRHAFWQLWDVRVRLYAFCCTVFVRDILMRCHAFLSRYERCVWDFVMLDSPLCYF